MTGVCRVCRACGHPDKGLPGLGPAGHPRQRACRLLRVHSMVSIRDIDHAGLAAIELIARGVRLVIVHGAGPRIAWFGRTRGENLFYWDDAGVHTRRDWKLRGGHRLWVTRPCADETEETYHPDNAACRVRRLRGGVAVTAPVDPGGIEKSLVVRATENEWSVTHQVRNAGDMLWSGGLWSLTCTRPARTTTYRIPLDGGAPSWDVITLVVPRQWGGGHTSRLADPQFRMSEREIVVRPRGVEAKRMVSAPRGTLVMEDATRGAFAKTARFAPQGIYPRATNVALYIAPGNFMVELETMSPMQALLPGETMSHVETWSLRPHAG
jgi:hypothetical protein